MKLKKLCKKCGDGVHCHYCGKYFDNRGPGNSFLLRDKGPTHYICHGCME